MTPAAAPLAPVPIARWRDGNTGVEHVWRFDAGVAGPTVMLQALTHGNEPCGAIALDRLLERLSAGALRPVRGALVVAFANVEAYLRFDPGDPDRSRYVDEDYNRVWADDVLHGARDSLELRRARALRPFVEAADVLLDLHSMHEPCRPIMVCGTTGGGGDKGVRLARRLGVPSELLVDTGHPSGRRMIEHGGFADPDDPRTALLIECGQHAEPAAADVAIDTVFRLLAATGVLEPATVASWLRVVPPAAQRLIRVTEAVVARSASFRFVAPVTGLQVVPRRGDPIAVDGDTVIRAPYDDTVLVMPSVAHLQPGTTTVRLGRIE